MVEWNRIFRLFRFSGILGQPREVHPKFRNEIPENVCSIRSPTRNFRNFWSNGKRPNSTLLFSELAISRNSEDICLQTLTSFSITWVTITRACGWQKSFRAGQILCAQTNFQHDFRQVSILEFPSNFDSEAFS